jgi:zinc transporter, ZIP family
MGAALGWGALAAASLVVGAVLGLARRWSDRLVGLVLAFGAGALISAVSFELAEEGIRIGGGRAVMIGLAAGALTYFALDWVLDRGGGHRRGSAHSATDDADPGIGLALGAFLDGIPEQLVLGIGLATGDGVSLSLLIAIFVSNLPEAIGSATAMRDQGRAPRFICSLWIAVATVCTAASVAGYALADHASDGVKAAINGFAAGALLVMLIDSMIPEAAGKAGRTAGLVTTLGFAVAAGLSTIS